MPIVNSIVAATTDMYESISRSLFPTPAKSHYSFNLRDFARVVNGHLLFKKESAGDKNIFVK